ncbi:uncharacterized protein LOC125821815 [Solanum verrucosum]|uniref:uncharacterized protein LOC125821815 n=1 Tax=Solanum verrucosum TaxID=315347 RepID=UPI0020D114BB|nr:uncharacterized protein LOC125821815 [Solanum verrucosum]
MWIALTAKNKSGFIDGSTKEPEVGTDLHRSCVIYYSTAKDIWEELEDKFGQSSGPQLFQLQKELSDLVQGSSDIAGYYTKIKRLWDELDTLDTFSFCPCDCTCGAKKKNIKAKQDERLVQFLMGLNDSYCAPIGNIQMISPLPSISNSYALLIQEEKQREVHNTPKFPGESSSFVVANQANVGPRSFSTDFRAQRRSYENKKSPLVCKYRKKPGHLIEKCYKLHGFSPNLNSLGRELLRVPFREMQ